MYEPQTPLPRYEAGKKELRFGGALLICCAFLWNAILYGGFHLGFSLGAVAVILCSCLYLMDRGYGFDRYTGTLAVFSLLIAAGFAVSSSYLKGFMLMVLLFTANLCFCLVTGQNVRNPGCFATLLDAPRACFRFGFGGMSPAVRGLSDARKQAGAAGKKSGAVIAGVLISLPLVGIMALLLTRADAAFAGLVEMLPDMDWSEPVWSVLVGGFAAWILYSRGVALANREREAAKATAFRGLSPITWNIPLAAVSGLYLVYLLSQLAYLGGGFSGILPEGYTLAQYARRGFFEMAWLSGINLGILLVSQNLSDRTWRTSRLARGLILYLGLITLFLIAAASAKMLLYIGTYGLTRLRVLTEIFMIWLAVTTVLVCIPLKKPNFPYMRFVILWALLVSTLTFWSNPDGAIARYNVRAYQSGKLETIDISHLKTLGHSAVPYVEELLEDGDSQVVIRARELLRNAHGEIRDFRDWNLPEARARKVLDQTDVLLPMDPSCLGIPADNARLLHHQDTHGGFHGDGLNTVIFQFTPEEDARVEELSKTDPLWHRLPLSNNVSQLLYGTNGQSAFYATEEGVPLMPSVQEGFWFFCDRHSASLDPADDSDLLFNRGSFNFTLAVYDSETHVLYFFELDT